jgi:hypothetical protein
MRLFELTEGLFKLPVETAMEILNGVMYTALKSNYEKMSSEHIKKLIADLLSTYSKPKNPTSSPGVFVVNMPRHPLPQGLQKHMKKDIPLRIRVVQQMASGWEKDNNIITINTKSIYAALMRSNPEAGIKGAIEQIKGTIVHELTHAYQQIIAKVDPRYDFKKSKYTSSGPKYYTGDIEFDPKIKSTMGFYHQLQTMNFDKDIIKPLINLIISGRQSGDSAYHSIHQFASTMKDHKKQLMIQNYANIFVELSNFFYHIRQDNPQRWKKAVKYLMGQIQL